MLRRKILNVINDWHVKGSRKALLLSGARQVGKTTAVREFARTQNLQMVEINFVKRPTAIMAFEGNLDTKTIIMNLSAMGYGPFVKGKTLVFFDEIQECPKARTAIKFLVEENVYNYIESGSLLGINYKPVPSYPVGYEEEVAMYPLDFEEFLWANGISETIIATLRECYDNLLPVPEFIHERIIEYYRQFLIVGGMPEAVQTFVNTPDFNEVIKVQRSIMTTYRADITNYAGSSQTLVKRVFDAIPSELGKQDKRFVLANIEKGASHRKYEDPTQWLIDSGIAYYSFNTSAFELPFVTTENRKLYKLYMLDTGLLCSASLKGLQIDVLNGNLEVNNGALTENFVACTLVANNHSLHYYDRKSRQELDFIIEEDCRITIVEVKSGKDYHKHASLSSALNLFKSSIHRAIVLSPYNLSMSKGVIYMPLYFAMFI